MKKIINNIEVLALVYKSVDYLKMIHRELVSEKIKVDGWDVSFRIVANDATHEVLEYLKENDINHSIYKDPKPQDFYLNRVYRCWNYAGNTSNFSNICFVNSDMVFSKNWLTNLK